MRQLTGLLDRHRMRKNTVVIIDEAQNLDAAALDCNQISRPGKARPTELDDGASLQPP